MTAIAALATFAGALAGSATGFGFALVLSPALFAVLEPAEAVSTLLVLSLLLNALVLFEGGRPLHVDWRRLLPLLPAALPGLVLGVLLLDLLSRRALQLGVGVAVLAAAGWQLRNRAVAAGPEAPRKPLGPAASLATGFTTGVLTTSLSVSGPPLVLWLEAHGVGPAEFRATLAACFLALSVAGAAVLFAAEGGSALDPGILPLLLAAVLAGYAVGALAFRRLDHERFFTVALALVAASGAASLAAGLGLIR